MYDKFENLNAEKRERILSAAMREFAGKGFDQASTNRIVEEAGIAKGLLFHYFKSKKQLFLYLFDYCIDLVLSEVMPHVDMSEKDFFVRMMKAQVAKMELVRKWPDIMNFLKVAYLENATAVRQDLDDRSRELMLHSFRKAFDDIDTSMFRQDADPGTIINTVAWAYEGFANTYLEKIRKVSIDDLDYEGMLAETKKYTDFLKKCFYQQ